MKTSIVLLVPILVLAGCGGSGGGSPAPVTVDLSSEEGWQRSVAANGSYNTGLLCGDQEGTVIPGPFRACLGFDLASVPAGATVVSAQLTLRQGISQGNPYGELGEIVVDHVDYGAGFPDHTHFAGGTLSSDLGTITSQAASMLRTLDVTSAVADDVASARGRSQFRLRFTPLDASGDVNDDYTYFEDVQNHQGTGDFPVLTVTYTP